MSANYNHKDEYAIYMEMFPNKIKLMVPTAGVLNADVIHYIAKAIENSGLCTSTTYATQTTQIAGIGPSLVCIAMLPETMSGDADNANKMAKAAQQGILEFFADYPALTRIKLAPTTTTSTSSPIPHNTFVDLGSINKPTKVTDPKQRTYSANAEDYYRDMNLEFSKIGICPVIARLFYAEAFMDTQRDLVRAYTKKESGLITVDEYNRNLKAAKISFDIIESCGAYDGRAACDSCQKDGGCSMQDFLDQTLGG